MNDNLSDKPSDELFHEPRSPRRAVAWTTLGVAALAVAGGVYAATGHSSNATPAAATGAAVAATSSASASPAPSLPRDRHGPMGRMGPMMGPGGFGGLGMPGRVLHGESTVQTPSGGTEIIDTQRGTISAIGTANKTITVTSSDKVAFTYTIDSNTRLIDFALSTPRQATLNDLKVGDTVGVVAVRSGDTRTARSVVDGAKTGAGWPGRDGGPRGRHMQPPPNMSPNPSASPSASAASA